MSFDTAEKIKLDTVANFNKATEIIFKNLHKVSSLENGIWVKGKIHESVLKMALYSEFFKYTPNKGEDWGKIADKDIEKFLAIEKFFQHVINKLEDLNLVERDWYDIKFTKKGYLEFCIMNQKGETPSYFQEENNMSQEDEKTDEPPTNLLKLELDEEHLEKIILEKIYEYEIIFRKKIPEKELMIRVIQNNNPNTIKFNSIHDLEKSKLFDNVSKVKQSIRDTLFRLFRENLIEYDYQFSTNISLTRYGRTYLSEGKNTYKEEIKRPNLEVSTIIHITDLHFGSFENTGVDNKEGMSNISAIEQNNIDAFINSIEEEITDDTFLIVSGDLTSRNEEEGFKKAREFLKKIGLGNQKTYIVPGNHDYERQDNEILAFAAFKHYFDDFPNPLHMTNYILNPEQKIFIYGFKSVHFERIGEKFQEVIYIHNDDLNKLKKLIEEKTKEIEDFNNFIKIAVVHHNMIDHPGVEVKAYSHAVNAFAFKHNLMKMGFSIVLSGHKHIPLIERQELYIENFRGDLLFISGGSLFGTTSGIKNSFQVIKIYSDINNGKIHHIDVYQYERNSIGEFVKNPQPVSIQLLTD
jgi:DNA repair exonuclease SbcCD nuclease subunit